MGYWKAMKRRTGPKLAYESESPRVGVARVINTNRSWGYCSDTRIRSKKSLRRSPGLKVRGNRLVVSRKAQTVVTILWMLAIVKDVYFHLPDQPPARRRRPTQQAPRGHVYGKYLFSIKPNSWAPGLPKIQARGKRARFHFLNAMPTKFQKPT
ncbi:hypothetical protein L209DRAFT_23696 [Thermothelomyces heterothallicus CBS 203.75]